MEKACAVTTRSRRVRFSKQREEDVEFCLHGAAYAREQKGAHGGEGQRTAARDETRCEAAGLQKILRIQEVGQPVYDMSIFRPSWKSYMEQCVTRAL